MKEERLINSSDIQDPAIRVLFEKVLENNERLLRSNLNLEDSNRTLQESNQKLQDEVRELRRALFGPTSERWVGRKDAEGEKAQAKKPLGKRKPKTAEEKRKAKEAADKKRKDRRNQKKSLPSEEVQHKLPDELTCPSCGGEEFSSLGEGEVHVEYDYIEPQILQRIHTQEKKRCDCCREHVATAEGPARVVEGCHYGPGLHANVVVSKCADSLPLHRQQKRLERAGVPINKSTLCELFHRSARVLWPIYARMLELLAEKESVNADETRLRVQDKGKGKTRTAWMWTFLTKSLLCFVFSASRSGETPETILKDSEGTLQVDGYTGYNKVCVPNGRERIGCWAHARRKFHEAAGYDLEFCNEVMTRIRALYEVEYRAASQNALGTEKHLSLRRLESKKLLVELKTLLDKKLEELPPKGKVATAVKYALNQWEALCAFVENPKVALDNNLAERALRTIAVGRKNFLFVGNDKAGKNLACLQSLVSTCIANEVNPQHYLADVLIRVQTHPQSRIDELLPMNWKSLA